MQDQAGWNYKSEAPLTYTRPLMFLVYTVADGLRSLPPGMELEEGLTVGEAVGALAAMAADIVQAHGRIDPEQLEPDPDVLERSALKGERGMDAA